jgi:hypothetical protein
LQFLEARRRMVDEKTRLKNRPDLGSQTVLSPNARPVCRR